MADLDLTSDEYGLLGNAAAAPDGRFRYAEPSDASQIAAVLRRVADVRRRLVAPGYLELIPGYDPNYPDFQITEQGRRLLEARSA